MKNTNEINTFCKKNGITIFQFDGQEKIGGSLYLSGLTSIPEGFNPTVGGYLYLSGLTSIPEGFNPTVGGYIDLSGLTSKYKKLNGPVMWPDKKYIKADGIFQEIVSKRGNVYKVRYVHSKNVSYLVTDGEFWAHGETLAEAKADLKFKRVKDASEYEGKSVDTVFSEEDAIVCYRSVTGACSAGVRNFLQNHLEKRQKTYSILEMAKLTKGHYGNNDFINFFKIQGV